jgi:hypothetical protein
MAIKLVNYSGHTVNRLIGERITYGDNPENEVPSKGEVTNQINTTVPTANPDMLSIVNGLVSVKSIYRRPNIPNIDFSTSALLGSPSLPIYDTFTIVGSSVNNSNWKNQWEMFFSCVEIPSIISNPESYMDITGTILTGYSNLNRLSFEVEYVLNQIKLIINIAQISNGNLDLNAPNIAKLHYRFEETSNFNTIIDSSGNGNTGTMIRGSDGSGVVSNITTRGVGVDGQSLVSVNLGSGLTTLEIIEIPHSESIALGPKFTISMWVNITDLGNFVGLYSKDTYSSVSGNQSGIFFWISNTTGLLEFRINYSTTHRLFSNYSFNVSSGWKHITYTFEEGVGLKLYIDGVLDAELNTLEEINIRNESAFIGTNSPSNSSFRSLRTNQIDELKYWKTNLSAEEVLSEYNQFAP